MNHPATDVVSFKSVEFIIRNHVYCVCNPQCLYMLKSSVLRMKKGIGIMNGKMKVSKASFCRPLAIMAKGETLGPRTPLCSCLMLQE